MDELELLVEAICRSAKYRHVCPEVIRSIGAHELVSRQNWKKALKATKNKLHQVGGAYFDMALDYDSWLRRLQDAAASADSHALRSTCAEMMKCQSSTRERLTILDHFYAELLAGLAPPRVVLDIACGLHPLAIPWIPLDSGAEYYAYDIYTDLVQFLNAFLSVAGVSGQAEARDVVQSPPTREADVAFVFKSLPCLEQLDRTAGQRLLEAIRVPHVFVSFPVRSLGGRDKSMLRNYEAHFWQIAAGKGWSVQRFLFATELVFRISK